MIFSAPDFHLRKPCTADARMQDGLQFFTRGRVGKDNPCQFIATQAAVVSDYSLAEGSLDFSEGGFARLDESAGQFIRVHDRHGAGTKDFSSRGFAHAHTPG